MLVRVDETMSVIPQKSKPSEEQEESSDRKKEEVDVTSLQTEVVAFTTNARKRKLFCFFDIVRRMREGTDITAEDPIFEQFNLKCPKCGRVYSDQNRKICEHCMNRGAVVKRLLAYFKGFELELFTVFFCMIMTSVVALVNPIISNKILLDQVISEPDVINGRQIGTMHSEIWV